MGDIYIASQVGVMGSGTGKNAMVMQHNVRQQADSLSAFQRVKINPKDADKLIDEIREMKEYLKIHYSELCMSRDDCDILVDSLAQLSLALKKRDFDTVNSVLNNSFSDIQKVSEVLGCSFTRK